MNDKQAPKQRTTAQNRAMWKYLDRLSTVLNQAGLDVRTVLKPEVDIFWTKDIAHDYLWIPIQKIMFKTESTTELTTDQVDKIYKVIDKHISEKFDIRVDFPSIETLINKSLTEIK